MPLFIFNFLSYLILLYLIVYGVYLLTINIKALFRKKSFNGSNLHQKENKICVIIYANSKSKNLDALLHSLNEQTYSRSSYSTHVIFAKDAASILYTPECMLGAQIHCIENPDFFKKDKALNTFIQKLIVDTKFDAYVFLGANRFVKSDYIESVNKSLNEFSFDVMSGKTNIVPAFKSNKFMSKILSVTQEFKNNTVNISRRLFELACVIDSENCVIRGNILEKTGRICFETREDELKYSLFLASNNIKPVFVPQIETTVEAESYNPTTSSLGVRFSLFKYYLKMLFKKPWYFVEFILSMIYPNVAVIMILYLLLFYSSFKFINTIGLKYVIHLGIFYVLIWMIGLIASRLNPVKLIFFAFYPFYSFILNFRKITKDISKKLIQKTFLEEKRLKSASFDAVVTDGKKDVMCKMDLISEDGMRRVILRFRKKRVISDECIRMYDAMKNISKKVNTRGYTLKICQNCANFEIRPDGTVDLLNGVCHLNSNSENQQDETNNEFETLVWNTCSCFVPEEITEAIENLDKNNNK